MSDNFKVITPEEISENTFKAIGKDWMLITAGSIEKCNTMTASWGGLGVLWAKNVAICFIRPTRYTYEFIEKADTFTLSFFEEKYRKALQLCGTKSGRDIDKVAAAGITPVASDSVSVYFSEAKLVLECRKLYYQDINPENFLDKEIDKNYPNKDYHRMYVGEIIKCLVK